jgi:16S rRNA (cytidine1402-2'-O)-methyltransferase
VALVSDAGTPLLSDPGARFVEAARASGSRIVPVPGPSAILAALVASGLATRPFTFIGFLPRKGQARRRSLEQLRRVPGTIVLFEAPGRVNQTLQELHDLLGDRPVAIARELTKLHEQILRGHLGTLRLEEERGEVTLIIEGGEDEAPDRMPDAQVDALIERLLAEGGSTREVAREVAELSGHSRSQIYSRLLARDEKP